ncbi:golgin subfamily A member 6-like protein 4, partial [Aplysia californica]|uniref:Golgin subfamily A member 6-like protein 4 n=1 Tax=Aplysia californica TaxID=6500 RepID=A0ABM1A4U8_APLCA
MSHRILPLLFTTILCITPGLCQSNSDDAQSLPIPEIMDILNVIDTSLDDIVVRVRRLLDEASDGRETRIVSKQISEVCEVYLRTTSNLQQRVRILLTEIEEKGRTGGTDSDIADVNWILARTMEVVRNMESILVRTKAHLSSKETHGDLQWVLTNLEDLKSEADYLIGFARSRYSTDESRTPDSQRRKETETRQEEERKRKIEESKRELEERNREMEERNREREERNREIEERKLEKEERKLEKEERNMEKEERNMER